jgi:hypothetical protein
MATVTLPKKFSHEETQRRVRHPLQLVRQYIRRYIFLEGVALTLLCAALLFWLGLALDFGMFKCEIPAINLYGIDWMLEFNEIDTSGYSSLGCRIIVLTVIVVGLAAFGFAKVVLRWIREFNDRSIALVLERRFPRQLGDRLITAVELADPRLAKKYGYSQVMVEKTILEAVEVLKKLPVASVFNWRRLFRLWFLVGLSTLGMLVLAMVVFCAGSFFAQPRMMSPYGFAWRFYDVAAIWTERNVLMMSTYWPRRSHLEIGRFQPSKDKDKPDDMRVAKDDTRPELTVRAIEWVVADRDVEAAPHGWRALRWQDLPRFIDQSLLDAVAIPPNFPHWKIDPEELEPNLVAALFGADAQIKSSGEIRAHLQQPAVRKKTVDRGAEAMLESWLDWKQWTVDKIALQRENIALRDPMVVQPALAASTVALMGSPLGGQGALLAVQGQFPGRIENLVEYEPVETVFNKLEELAESPAMSRTLRKLVVPGMVEVNFRGEESGSNATYKKEDGNKFSVSLEPLKDSKVFKFRARGENYFTPPKTITLVPAPTPASISIDKEEPAYIYHRLTGPDQMPLKGKKHVTNGLGLSMTGESNTIGVPLGSKLVIHVKTKAERIGKDDNTDEVNENDRKLRAERPVFVKDPPTLVAGFDPFRGQIKIDDDYFGFSLEMDNITRNHDFVVEFFDEDNIRGKRRFKVLRTLDAEPHVGNLNVLGYLPRKPKFKTQVPTDKEKDKADVREQRDQTELASAYLITPDAYIPLECKIADDYGLVRVGYHYKYRKVDFELIAQGGRKLPSLEIDQATRNFRFGHAVGHFQFWPFNSLGGSAVLANSAAAIERDIRIAQGYKEGYIPSPAFDEVLKERAGEMVHPDDLIKKLTGIRSAKAWEFDFKQDPGFDLQRYLKELKAGALDDLGQMHYYLQVAVQATDNNVETGAEYAIEVDAKGPDGAKIKKTLVQRGNTKRNANGYLSFIVVSENELLSQIALEEDTLNEKLEAAKEKVDAGMVSLLEQQSKTRSAQIADMENILIRMNEIRTALADAGKALNETHQAYENILKEMTYNRVDKTRISKIENNIITRLEQIVVQDPRIQGSGSLPRALDTFQKAHQLVEEETNAKQAPDVEAHRLNMNDAHRQLGILSSDIKLLLDAMSEGIVESKLIALLTSIEAEQRKINRDLHNQLIKEQLKTIEELLKGTEKDKKKDSKEEKKDQKKTSQLGRPRGETNLLARLAVMEREHLANDDKACEEVLEQKLIELLTTIEFETRPRFERARMELQMKHEALIRELLDH